jgi:NADH:ubiquinone oxidoreductase subunit E
MINKTIIKVCLGSSCFSRGSKELTRVIKKFIIKNRLEDKVFFSGDHCFDKCSEGLNIRINGKIFQHVNIENITGILEEELKDIL